jgi:predicted DCC family thiol-disulfide oxidoreductase YuxK
VTRWNRFWFEPGAASTLGACRLWFFGLLFLWMLPHDFRPWGNYASVFWMPIWLFDTFAIPILPAGALGWIQVAWKLSLLLAAVGLFTRPAMIAAFVLGTYLVGLPHNFGQTQHFDTLVVFTMAALALSRAGDACSIDALIAAVERRSTEPPAPSGEYTWPIRFVWVAMALALGAAGIAKLRHAGLDWSTSNSFSLLLLRQQYHISDGEPLTRWGIVIAQHPWLSHTMAATAMIVETLFPLSLFSTRARLLLVPAGLSFLIGIRLLMGPTFEQFMICYVFWVPWPLVAAFARERLRNDTESERLVLYDGGCGLCRKTVVVLSRLDLLHRIRAVDVVGDWERLSVTFPLLVRDACLTEMHVITGDGRVNTGFDAYRALAWVLPVGWVLLPILYAPGVGALGRRVYRLVASHRTTTSCALPVSPLQPR